MQKSLILKSHFILLALILLLELVKYVDGLYLLAGIETTIKLLWLITGIILFFKTKGKIRAYFFLFPLTVFLFVLALMLRGFLAMIFFFAVGIFFIKPTTSFKHNRVIIKQDQVLMSPFIHYSVYKRYIIFEKDKGDIKIENNKLVQSFTTTRTADSVTLKFDYINKWDSLPGDTSISLEW